MFCSSKQSHSVWCTGRGGGEGEEGCGDGESEPSSVCPFFPGKFGFTISSLASQEFSKLWVVSYSVRITGIRGKWYQWLGFMALNAELPNSFLKKFCDSSVNFPLPGCPRGSEEGTRMSLGIICVWERGEGKEKRRRNDRGVKKKKGRKRRSKGVGSRWGRRKAEST